VPGDFHVVEIVEAGAPQIAVAEIESGRTNDVDGHVHAGREPQDCPGILWNVRLIECQAHPVALSSMGVDLRAGH
jgi:hypothetical protein